MTGTSPPPSSAPAPALPPGPGPIRLLLADDQELLRTGYRMVLDAQPDLEVVAEAADGLAAVAAALAHVPDLVLMDVRMPGVDGIEATRRITAALPATRVLILTTFDLDDYVVAGLRAGASGFLLKDARKEELLSAIRAVAAGDAAIAPSATRRLIETYVNGPGPAPVAVPDPAVDSLTQREREVLLLVAHGLSNAEIAAELIVSETTVKTHVARMLAKLGLRDRVQAVVRAYEVGLVRPGGGPAAETSALGTAGSAGTAGAAGTAGGAGTAGTAGPAGLAGSGGRSDAGG